MMVSKEIIILILSIHLIVVNSDEQSNKDITKLTTYAKILLNGLTDHITYVEDKIVHLNQLSEKEMDDTIENNGLNQEKFKQMENKLNAFQPLLVELASMPLDKEKDISAAKKKSTNLQNELDHLNIKLDKYKICRNLPLLDDYKIEELLEKYKSLVAEKAEIDEKIEVKEQSQLVDDCILAIELSRYQNAAEKFNLVKDDNKLKDIVKRIYSDDGAYFLLSFGNNIKSLKRTFLLYKALYNKLHNDKERRNEDISWHFYKYLALMKSLKREILEQPTGDSDVKAKAAELLSEVSNEMVQLGTQLLTKVVNEGSTRSEESVFFLTRPLLFDYELVGEICYQTVIDNHKQHLDDLKETLQLVLTSLSKLYANGGGSALHFGHFIKYLETVLKSSEYESAIQLDLASWKEKLPEVVKNILYAKNVCIKQSGTDKYLKQIGDIYTYLLKSYGVYTTDRQRNELEERWQLLQVDGDKYNIKNILHNYLLDVDYTDAHKCNPEVEKTLDHQVITTNRNQEANVWKLEVGTDHAYIKNTLNNEYLYSSIEHTRDGAVTSTFNGELSGYYQWKIVDCTNVPLSQGPAFKL